MGAGASTEGIVDEELKALNMQYESLFKNLGDLCRQQLLTQKDVTFKNQTSILAAVSGFSKGSMAKYLLKEGKGGLTATDLATICGGGTGTYGDFLGRLPRSKRELKLQDVKVACGGVGMNVDSVAYVLCTTAPSDMQSFLQDCFEKFGLQLRDFVKARLPNKQLVKLLQTMMHEPRSVDFPDEEQLKFHAQVLATSMTKDDHFIPLLLSLSYGCLSRIRYILDETLETIIDNRFQQGQMRNFLRVWIQPHAPDAVAEIVCQQSSNAAILVETLSRYDSAFLQNVDSIVSQRTGKRILPLCEQALKGKLGDAFSAWTNAVLADGGAEEKIKELMDAARQQGMTPGDVYADPDKCAELKMLLQEAVDCLRAALNEKQVETAPDISLDEQKTADTFDERPSQKSNPPPVKRFLSKRFSINATADVDGDSFDQKYALVLDFLHDVYAAVDIDNKGYIPIATFWKAFSELDIANQCYQKEELELMPELVEDIIARDGYIYWEEAISELTDGLVSGLETHEIRVRTMIEQQTTAANDLAAVCEEAQVVLEQCGSSADVKVANICPDLLQYLRQTFDAFDTERKGYLSREDLWSFVQLLNLGLASDGPQLDELVQQIDINNDGMIEWNEAATKLDNVIHDMASDERDHWIGLQDVSSNPAKCYWYNLHDGASQWMSAEEQEGYRAADRNSEQGAFYTSPSSRIKHAGKVGTFLSLQRLKNSLLSVSQRKQIVSEDENLNEEDKAAAQQAIDDEYYVNVQHLQTHLGIAKALLTEQKNSTMDRKVSRRSNTAQKKVKSK